jgi:glycerol uptake facilitator-like aquaporin
VARRVVGEALGTAFLFAAVFGSGIMAERLAGGNVAIALLANTIATGAVLVALILTFGSISGAHFNPAGTPADASQGGLKWREVPVYRREAGAFRWSRPPRFRVLNAAVGTLQYHAGRTPEQVRE